jgi:oligopeptide/dipeptide ABC transporter ATP-binding protein
MANPMTDSAANDPLLRVEDLSVHFPVRGSPWSRGAAIRAVDGVSLRLGRARTLGLVGESGCGKSTLARAVLRLIPATAGRVHFEGRDVLALPRSQVRNLRRQMQIIFQDPIASLNPRLTVELIVGEALTVHRLVRTRRERRQRVANLLTRVGLSADALGKYPHEFSGGQRQRIGIARALALGPKLIICDEPVSALDVSIQSQILNVLTDLQQELGLSYLLIAHNLAVIRHCSDEVAVMYFGRIVEHAPTEELYARPAHPYTRALLAAVPRIEPPGTEPAVGPPRSPALPGEPPDPTRPPSGCAFHPRCPLAQAICRERAPVLDAHANLPPGHVAACHFAGQ